MQGGSLGNRQNLQTKHVGYANVCSSNVLAAPSNQQLLIHAVHAYNGSGSTADIGICKQLGTTTWKLWSIAASVTNVTSTVQAGSAVTLIGTTNNYGFIAQCSRRFSLMTFNISQAELGSPVYSYQYWNGSAWSTLSLAETPVYTATGQVVIAFNAPSDWAVGAGSLGPDETMYSIRVRGTTAPSTAVQINSLTLASFIAFRKSIPASQQLSVIFRTRALLLDVSEAILPYFSVASAQNTVEIAYQISG